MQFKASKAKNISLSLTLIGAFAYRSIASKSYLRNLASYISAAAGETCTATPNKSCLRQAYKIYASKLIPAPIINASKINVSLAQIFPRNKYFYYGEECI